MLKRHLRYYFFKWETGSRKWSRLLGITSYFSLLTFYLLGCAPKVAAPPPLYKDVGLSLEEIVKISQGNINSIKAITRIDLEKNDKPYTTVDSLMLLKKPGWLHIRLYKFGLPAGHFLMKDDFVYAVSDKGSKRFKEFGKELYYSVFWWDGIEGAVMHSENEQYVIRANNKEIRINKNTLLPELQEITVKNKKIYISYSEPQMANDVWYPSKMRIEIDDYRVNIKIEKLFINPDLTEDDFKEP